MNNKLLLVTWSNQNAPNLDQFTCRLQSILLNLVVNREVSHHDEHSRHHVVGTLHKRVSKSRRHLASFRPGKFVTYDFVDLLRYVGIFACKCNPIWLFKKELMTCSLSLSYSYWCETSLLLNLVVKHVKFGCYQTLRLRMVPGLIYSGLASSATWSPTWRTLISVAHLCCDCATL
jgi:hypothetical protein